jgi:hypothetical protein
MASVDRGWAVTTSPLAAPEDTSTSRHGSVRNALSPVDQDARERQLSKYHDSVFIQLSDA